MTSVLFAAGTFLHYVFGILMFSSLGTIGAYVAVWKGAQRAPAGGER